MIKKTIMNDIEIQAMKSMHIKLTECIDPLFIRGFLYQKGGISRKTAVAISKEDVRHKRAEEFLLQIVEECPMQIFLDSLTHSSPYSFLVEELKDKIKEVKERHTEKDEQDATINMDSECSTEAIPSVPNKVNVFTTRRNKVMKYKHMLKRLSHDGNDQDLMRCTERIHKRWRLIKNNPDVSVTQKNKMADLVFMAYDSDVENRRVKYDCSLYKDAVFDEMIKTIPFTSEPKVTSMTYLARYGSAITMKEPLDNGISHLQFAREHGEGITPCYESGIVIYIEHNLLVQKYEIGPEPELKKRLIRLAEEAISHFDEEDEALRLDYKRMLLLKIAFIHLGIGLFGENMTVTVEPSDLKAAKGCLDCVEESSLWNGMETRRKMFFHIAKSKYYELQQITDLALDHATTAKELANIGKFKKELQNIDYIISELNSPLRVTKLTEKDDFENVMKEFLGEFPDDE